MPLAFKRYPYGGLGDWLLPFAGVAQLVAQVLCNHQVAGSSPVASSIHLKISKIYVIIYYKVKGGN